jgi:ABC-type Fe3+/spermidine/putrescine transport system ATPase subunit
MGVAKFIGRSTILPAEDLGDKVAVTIGGVRRELAATRPNGQLVSPQVVLRPNALEISDEGWKGTVINRRFTGGSVVYRIKTEGDVVLEVESSNMGLREGDNTAVVVSREPVPVVSVE